MNPFIRLLVLLLALSMVLCTNEYPLSDSATQTTTNTQQSTQTETPASGDSLIWNGETILSTTQTIAAGQTYWCAPGTQLTLPAKGTLTVKGNLIIAGTSAQPVRIFSPSGSTILVSGKINASYLVSDGYGGSLLTGSGGSCVLSNVQISGYAKALDGVFDSISVRNGTFSGNTAAIAVESITGTTASGASLGDMVLSGIQITGPSAQSGTGIIFNGSLATRATILLQQVLFNNLGSAVSYTVPVAGAKLTAVNMTIHNCNDGIIPLTPTSGAFDTIIVSDADMEAMDTVISLDSAQGANQLIIENSNVTSQTATPVKVDKGAATSLQFNKVAIVDKSGFPYLQAQQVYKNVADSAKFKVLVLDSAIQSGLGAGYAYVAVTQPLTNEQPLTLSLPNVPVITATTAANGSITVTWNAAIGATTYNIYYELGALKSLDTAAARISGVSSPKTITGLANNQQYTFAVSAINAIGESNLSSVVVAVPLSLPSDPIIDSAIAADSSVSITWEPVSSATSYTLYYAAGTTVDKNAAKFTGVISPKTIKGLTNATQYAFAVTATNSLGEGPLSAIVTSTPGGPLSAPMITGAAAGNDSVTVSWNAVQGASSYNIYYAAGKTVGKTDAKISGVNSPKIVPGLANGTRYAFAVSAVNGGTESALSSIDTATPQSSPSAPASPAGFSAIAGNDSVTLTWSPVLGANSYVLYYAPGLKVDTTAASFANVSSGKTVTGLTNGMVYAFGVSAINATGKSALSVVTATPLAAPGVPTITAVSPGDSSDTVYFSSVTFATSYNLYIAVGTTVDTSTNWILTSVTSPYIVKALSDGVTYAYAVRAVNAAGKSALSKVDTSTPGIPLAAAPAAPAGVTAVKAASGQITVSWTQVNGMIYNVYYKLGASFTDKNGNGVTEVQNVSGSSKTISSLTTGQTYYFGVTAVGTGGESALSSPLVTAQP